MSIPQAEKHVVAFAYQAWGHTRPLAALAARLVKTGPVVVTLFTTFAFLGLTKAELSRSFGPGEETYAQRVRVVGLANVQMMRSDELDEAFIAAWKQLLAEEEIACAMTGERFPPVIKPHAAILDLFVHKPVRDMRAISGNKVKIYSWSSAQLAALYYLFGPEHLGGRGNLSLKIEEEAARSGRPLAEVTMQLMYNITGEVVRVPGLPPMYDYEYYPQDFLKPDAVQAEMFAPTYETLTMTDGIFVMTSESYEPEAVATLRKWYGDVNKSAYVVGPLLPLGSHASSAEKVQSKEADQIEAFLDDALKTSGERSLLYIAFGSLFWPLTNPEKLWAFLDVVMEQNIPFILSLASPFAHVPDAVKGKVQAYGKGLLSPWTPQQMILNHPATGWFVSHGGQNGVQEAIAAGVPQILWPFAADQPLNAVHLSETLGVGYELIEVRSGLGLKPIYRNGKTPANTIDALKEEVRDVLGKAFGDDGAQKRAKLLELRKAVLAEWEDGGHAKRDLQAFVEGL